MKNAYSIILFALLTACSTSVNKEVEIVNRLSTERENAYYVNNRPPLQPQQFVKLPVGTIQPEGWLKQQLILQKNGLNGHLGEISAWLQKENNAWLKTGG